MQTKMTFIKHNFHFIGGPGETRKLVLFKKLHAACCNNDILIKICTATSLAALSYEGATTAHSLFSYPVEDETDVDNQNLAGCNYNQEHCDFLYECHRCAKRSALTFSKGCSDMLMSSTST